MKRKILLVLAAMALIALLALASANMTKVSAETGSCGEGVTYDFDTSTGVLTISGSGSMSDYSITYISNDIYRTDAPWGRYYSSIKTVTINNGVTSIGEWAFSGCTELTSITIPDSVTSISWSAFSGCTGLTSITIPDSVMSIGSSAFYNCTGLTSITIPDSVTSIGSSAFSGCTGLTSISIPDSVTSVGSEAFSGCTGLTSITIPNSVTSIGDSAFRSCTGLTSITIPDSVTSIGWNAFSYCTGLTSITIPDSVTSIREGAFSGCTGIKEMTVPGTIYMYYAFGKTYPTWVEKVTIVGDTIGGSAFYGCTGLTNITIPDSVTSIGDWAFRICTGLTSITIPDSVTSIGERVFEGCTGLTSITIPNSVTSIGSRAFYGCTGLTSITIPDSVTSIGGDAFYNCTGLTSITIPDSVTSIGGRAFSGCTGLTSITIGNSVTSIGDNAFQGCTGLTSITIPDSVTSIGSQAFYGCTNLTNITIPSSVTSIGVINTFDGCSVYLTARVVEGSYAHAFCRRYSIPFEFYTPTSGTPISGKVTLSGKAEIGQTLTSTISGLAPVGADITYRWYRDGVAIKFATSKDYKLTYSDLGKAITLEVSGKGGYSGTLVSNKVIPTLNAPDGCPELSFESVETVADDVVAVELTVKNNAGIGVLVVTPVLPDGFKLVGAENGQIFKDMTHTKNTVFDGNGGEDGVLAVYSIKVPEDVKRGTYAVTFEVNECVSDDGEFVAVKSGTGNIKVGGTLYGDADNDGEIGALDIVKLKRYFAEIDASGASSVALGKGADCNGDGNITALDLIRLKKYIAAYDYKTQSSTVRLGN